MSEPLSVRERVHAMEGLERLAREANAAAGWLAGRGMETESDMAEAAAVRLMACAHLVARPISAQLPAARWQGVNGHQHG